MAKSREKMLARLEAQRVSAPRQNRIVKFTFPTCPPSGREVVTLAHARRAYGERTVLDDVSLVIERAERVALIGPNGAGKSTLLKLVAGLLRPSGGSVRFKEREIGGLGAPAISRQGLSFVPQERNVFGTMSVAENLEMGGFIDGSHARRRMAELYERFPMLADKRRAAARTLSGGQRQILAMAVALMNAPDLLLLDEPTAGLSPRAAEELFGTILALNQSGVAILMVEQNALEALSVSMRAYVLVQGRPEREGGAADLAADPTVRDLFLGGKAAPMLKSSDEGMGDVI
jgi:branched-chain amino acid transport system ATP-binding protein/neutral amino acid transport system ATP-binding protein